MAVFLILSSLLSLASGHAARSGLPRPRLAGARVRMVEACSLSGLPRPRLAGPRVRMVEACSLSGLEPASTAAYLAAEVREHLDREWIPQECHARIGAVCADVWLGAVAPAAGAAVPPRVEPGTLLIAIADALVAGSAESDLFREAFVGPYDVANLCSDLLLHRLGGSAGCDCNVVPTGVGELAAAEVLRGMGGGK